jgi:hypothetical protein
MDFDQASKFIIPWGDYAGKRIGKVAEHDLGLKDLDRLLGWMEDKNHRSRFRHALEAFLSDPSIKKELEGL